VIALRVKAIAAHHFSYVWAKTSSYGLQAARWWRTISRAGDRTAAFWKYVSAKLNSRSWANLPGELS
jgi:hypothetical protein